MSKAEYQAFERDAGHVRVTGCAATRSALMRIRRAHAHGSKLSVVFVDGGGLLTKCMATIVSYMPFSYIDDDGDVLYIVDLEFDGDDPSDDGVQAVWLKDMAAQGDALVEGRWALEGDQSLLEAGCARCRWIRSGCTSCRAAPE